MVAFRVCLDFIFIKASKDSLKAYDHRPFWSFWSFWWWSSPSPYPPILGSTPSSISQRKTAHSQHYNRGKVPVKKSLESYRTDLMKRAPLVKNPS